MDAGLVAQYIVIALAVVLSLVVVARKQFPEGVRRMRIALALPLLREGKGPRSKRLGRWLAPAPRYPGDRCGGCSGCDDKP